MSTWLRGELAAAWAGGDAFDRVRALEGSVYRAREGRRTLRFELNGRAYFVKHHRGVGWREILRNLLRGRAPVLGAGNEYSALRVLHTLGLEVPAVAGFGCRGGNPARRESFLITDALVGVTSLETLCADWARHPPPPAFKRHLIERVAGIAARMHAAGINHRDFYLCHLLLGTDGAASAPAGSRPLYLLDLHRARQRRTLPRRWRAKDLGALYHSAMDIGLGTRDVLRFVRAYHGGRLRAALDQSYWRPARRRARRIYRRDHGRAPDSPAWHLPAPGRGD